VYSQGQTDFKHSYIMVTVADRGIHIDILTTKSIRTEYIKNILLNLVGSVTS